MNKGQSNSTNMMIIDEVIESASLFALKTSREDPVEKQEQALEDAMHFCGPVSARVFYYLWQNHLELFPEMLLIQGSGGRFFSVSWQEWPYPEFPFRSHPWHGKHIGLLLRDSESYWHLVSPANIKHLSELESTHHRAQTLEDLLKMIAHKEGGHWPARKVIENYLKKVRELRSTYGQRFLIRKPEKETDIFEHEDPLQISPEERLKAGTDTEDCLALPFLDFFYSSKSDKYFSRETFLAVALPEKENDSRNQ